MIEQAVRALLTTHVAVAPLVAGRVFPVILPQAVTYPAITYQTITGASNYSMDGSSELANSRMQFDCYATSFDAVTLLKAAVMKCLSGFSGSVGTPPVEIQGAFRVNETDDFEQPLDGPGPRVWRKTLDFIIWHKEIY